MDTSWTAETASDNNCGGVGGGGGGGGGDGVGGGGARYFASFANTSIQYRHIDMN